MQTNENKVKQSNANKQNQTNKTKKIEQLPQLKQLTKGLTYSNLPKNQGNGNPKDRHLFRK
jgi:hypothetical protein